jgi:hypothetical protein
VKVEDFFIILLPSKSDKMFIATAFTLACLPDELGKLPLVAKSGAPTYDGARNGCVQKLKEVLEKHNIGHGPVVRALWMDDDMLIDEPLGRVVEAIKKAEELHANIVANYKIIWTGQKIINALGLASTIDGKGDAYFATDEQLEKLKNFEKLPPGSHCGLGFYYGDLPLDYKFHYDTKAEDVHFFQENKIELTYVDLLLRHDKHVLI